MVVLRTGQHFTAAELAALTKGSKQPKYRNKPTFADGQRFDSIKEAKRYGELRLLARAGEISDLELQPEFEFIINGELFLTRTGRVFKYRADFRYRQDGKTIVEDVKSPITEANPVYRMKRDLMRHVHGIIIFET